MKRTLSALLPLALFLALPLAASAQAVSGNGITVSSSPSTTYLSGTPPVVGTITLSGTEPGGVVINSVPVTLSTAGGATANQATNCSLYNYGAGNNASLTTNNNVLAAPVNGVNTFTLDQPLTIPYNGSVTLTVRCNLDNNTPAGGTFAFAGGVPSPYTGTMSSTTSANGNTTSNTTITGTPSTGTAGVPNTGTTVGVPNTGAGGDATTNVLLIDLAIVALIGAGVYAYRLNSTKKNS